MTLIHADQKARIFADTGTRMTADIKAQITADTTTRIHADRNTRMDADTKARIAADRIDMDGAMLYEGLTYAIRGAVYEVYNVLGPGFKEDIYHNALANELRLRSVSFVEKKRIEIDYKGETVGIYQPDFVIEQKVLVEIKSMPHLPRVSEAQLLYYLKGTAYKLGLLINFGAERLEIRRRIYDSARPRKNLLAQGDPRSSALFDPRSSASEGT